MVVVHGQGAFTHGTFLVGEHDANFQDVTSAPQLPVVSPGDRWAVVLDAMNINGAPFTFDKSSVPGTPDGKVVALLDTGYSFPPLPPAAVDAIYSSIPGAVRDPSLGFPWVVPCNASLKLSFVFACVFPCYTSPVVAQPPCLLAGGRSSSYILSTSLTLPRIWSAPAVHA